MHPDYWDRDQLEFTCDHAAMTGDPADECCSGEAEQCHGCSDNVCVAHRDVDGYCMDCISKMTPVARGIVRILATDKALDWRAA